MKQIFETRLSSINANKKNVDGPEIGSGRLCLLQCHAGKKRKVPVFVRVYKSCFEQYAVVYRDQKYSLQSGYVNLKNCIVKISEDKKTQFKVILNDLEGSGLTFETDSHSQACDWVDVLQPQIVSSSPKKSSLSSGAPPVITRSSLMPTVEEDEDE